MDQKKAEKLWALLRQHFVNAQRTIEEIIRTEAWKPLGFSTFTEAWAANMANVAIASELRAHVVYQMLSEGRVPSEVADIVKGVGPVLAESYKRQRDNETPAAQASSRPLRSKAVHEHETIFVKVPKSVLHRWRRIAAQYDRRVDEIALAAIESTFRELDGNGREAQSA